MGLTMKTVDAKVFDIEVGDVLIVMPDESLDYSEQESRAGSKSENYLRMALEVIDLRDTKERKTLLVRRGLRRYEKSAAEIEKIFLDRQERRSYS